VATAYSSSCEARKVSMTLDPVMLVLIVGAFMLFLGYLTLLSRL
jgi:hypothetical protein